MPQSIMVICLRHDAMHKQGWLSPLQKGISPLLWGEKPFCRGETGEKLPAVFILRCKA